MSFRGSENSLTIPGLQPPWISNLLLGLWLTSPVGCLPSKSEISISQNGTCGTTEVPLPYLFTAIVHLFLIRVYPHTNLYRSINTRNIKYWQQKHISAAAMTQIQLHCKQHCTVQPHESYFTLKILNGQSLKNHANFVNQSGRKQQKKINV